MKSNFEYHELRNLPKIDLHRHLDCSMRWSTMIELAPKVGLTLPKDILKQQDELLVTSPMKDLQSVLKKFLNAQKLLASEELLERLAFEACEDAFNDGIRILELRYAPSFINDGHFELSFENIHQALLKGIQKAEKNFNMAVGLIGIVQRIKSYKEAEKVVQFFIENKKTCIALDLADSEDGFDPKTFAPLFQKAKKEGLRITIHSGEVPNKLSPLWVRDSIEILGAERIGHGIQIINNPEVLKFVIDHKIPLEVCPYSNYLTQAYPTYESHPINDLKKAGVILTINSDDPGVFASTLTDDFHLLHKYHNWRFEDYKTATVNAFKTSFIPEQKKQKVWDDTYRRTFGP